MSCFQIKTKMILGLMIAVLPLSTISVEAKRTKKEKTPTKTCENQKMDKISSFSYHQSGGFAAINRGYSVKLAELSKEEAEKLASLIQSSGLLKMKNERKTTAGAADMFFYEFSASDGGEHKATFDDGSLPESFRPLLDFVRDKAKVEPRN
ncbi:MAG TPA: hypothetical protein EYN91_19715 [Candidatus Melainabacteria bacterium]|nr:hypothetical protein [Candidatus Melainabacteria bacterium]HIN65201.1 hypothetical protein [Candidatus Obscuribacterales bacterium]